MGVGKKENNTRAIKRAKIIIITTLTPIKKRFKRL